MKSIKYKQETFDELIWEMNISRMFFAEEEEEEEASIVVSLKDITKRKQTDERLWQYSRDLEEEVEKRTKKLEQSNKMKSAFIADASHELRTPLTIMKSNIELSSLVKSKLPQELEESYKIIDTEISQVSKLIGDLTFLSQADEGMEFLNEEDEFQFDQLIHNIVNRLQHSLCEKNIKVRLALKQVSAMTGNQQSMERLIMNLINNAIKYNIQNGSIDIELKQDGKWLVFSVRDSGIGISFEDLPNVFERFYRVDKARSRKMGSTGLGLSICKVIVEARGGTINVQSIFGKGSEFVVRLLIG